jgi:hypothetical protein
VDAHSKRYEETRRPVDFCRSRSARQRAASRPLAYDRRRQSGRGPPGRSRFRCVAPPSRCTNTPATRGIFAASRGCFARHARRTVACLCASGCPYLALVILVGLAGPVGTVLYPMWHAGQWKPIATARDVNSPGLRVCGDTIGQGRVRGVLRDSACHGAHALIPFARHSVRRGV